MLAGGVMGVLAAVNDEVERGHVANISLILLVIVGAVTLFAANATNMWGNVASHI